jgi:hypothetical protein
MKTSAMGKQIVKMLPMKNWINAVSKDFHISMIKSVGALATNSSVRAAIASQAKEDVTVLVNVMMVPMRD